MKEDFEKLENDLRVVLFHAEKKLKALEHPIVGESAKDLYDSAKSIYDKLSQWAFFDDHNDDTLVKEIKCYLSESLCVDFKDTQVQDSTAFVHCSNGIEIIFSVGKDRVFFKGYSGSKVDERMIPRNEGRTVARSIKAINDMMKELSSK